MRTAIGLAILAALLLVTPAPPADADHGCARAPWPSFEEVAPTAKVVVVGTVAEDLGQPSGDPTFWFRLDVEEVLRGLAPPEIEVQGLRSGVPRKLATDPDCEENPTLTSQVGDRIAIAYDGRMAGARKPVTTVAFIDGERRFNPGAERLTLARARRITGHKPDGSTTWRPGGDASSDVVDMSRGRWQKMARAPFGVDSDLAVWTGKHMIVTEWSTGLTARYDPRQDRWRKLATAPRPVDSVARHVWTGAEFIIVEVDDDGPSFRGLAYDPVKDRWRELEPLPAEADGEDHGLAGAVWTGTHMIVVDALGTVAAYEPTADRWTDLPRVPGDGTGWGAFWTGSELLVESRDWTAGEVSIQALDPEARTWSEPVPGPLDVDAVRSGGTGVGDRLVYVTWAENEDGVGALDAVFDPSTMSWSVFEHDCHTRAFGRNIEAGGLLLASDGRLALDGETLACVDLPPPPRRLNGTEVMVWTGSELIAWSGIRSLPEPPRRGGFVYRPS